MKLYKCTKNIFGFEKRIRKFCCLPSDEGSGLKYTQKEDETLWQSLPSDEGSGLKYSPKVPKQCVRRLPSDEGSGLKLVLRQKPPQKNIVFPRMREVD